MQVIPKFPHKPALVVFDSYCFSTASLNTLNPSINPTDLASPGLVVKTKFIGALTKDDVAVTEAMDGRVNCPDE